MRAKRVFISFDSPLNNIAVRLLPKELSERCIPVPAKGAVMSGVEDLLLYPLATGDQPVCPKCCSPLVLVGFQSERGMPDFSSFRCPDCGRSETFADDDHVAP